MDGGRLAKSPPRRFTYRYGIGYSLSVSRTAHLHIYSVDNGDPLDGKPERIGPLKPGTHTLRVWADNDNAPAVASWRQSPPPAFGSTTVKVNVNTSGWHTLHANATDPLNRPDQVGAHFNFYADYTAPTAIIKDPPPGTILENHGARLCDDDYACSDGLTVKIDDQPPSRQGAEATIRLPSSRQAPSPSLRTTKLKQAERAIRRDHCD